MKKLKWGILGCAKIAREHLIPAIQQSQSSEVVAIASRSGEKAQACANDFGIAKAYDSYEKLLADSDVDVIYIPMPNHMHIPWSIKAMEAGKHVLCEKPLGLNEKDVLPLINMAKQYPHLKVMEAFMYRFHPQWDKAKGLIESGDLGDIQIIEATFTYNSFDPKNVRYQKDIGGGSLLDVGCYCVSASRYLFGCEPKRVIAVLDSDPLCEVDRHVTGLLDFGVGMARFSSSMQVEGTQALTVLGSKGRMRLESPFFLPGHKQSRIIVTKNGEDEVFIYENMNHYIYQVEALAASILNDTPAPTPLSDALSNMAVIDALFESHQLNAWVNVNK